MTITKTFRADVVASVPGRWARQYARYGNDRNKVEIGKRLRDLPAGFTADEVDQIIGNKSWTAHDCDECGGTYDVLVRIGEEPDYEARYVSLCANCLAKAVAVSAPPSSTTQTEEK